MREKLITLAVSTLATLFAAAADGQTCPGGYACQQPAAYAPGRVALYHPVYRVPAPTYYVTAPAPVAVAVAPAAPVPQPQPAGGGYGAALAVINAERARWGRGPLGWSSWLASYAATNNAVHAPGSSGGGSQTWAGVSDPVQAVRMWIASPAHYSIMINAVQSVGISLCPSGCTANFN